MAYAYPSDPNDSSNPLIPQHGTPSISKASSRKASDDFDVLNEVKVGSGSRLSYPAYLLDCAGIAVCQYITSSGVEMS